MRPFLNKAFKFCKRNMPVILGIVATGGVVVTTISAIKASPKAETLLAEAEEKSDDELTTLDKVKIVAPVYVPTIVWGVTTITCILGSCALSKHNQASLMSAYALLDKSYGQYQAKLRELYGNEAHDKIIDAIAVEEARETYMSAPGICECYGLHPDDYQSERLLFYDSFSQRYFETTLEQVLNAEYHLNRNYVLRGYATANELYDFLGLDHIDGGNELGWGVSDEGTFWIDFNHRKVTIDNDLECIIIETMYAPTLEWMELYGYI